MTTTKFVIIPIIALIILAGFLTTDPNVSSFFHSVKSKFYSITKIEPPVSRAVNFSVYVDSYDDIQFDRSAPMNVSVSGYTNATFDKNYITFMPQQDLAIINYRGRGEINNDTLLLNGTFERLSSQDLSIGTGGRIVLQSNFTKIEIVNMRLPSIYVQNASGTLTMNASSTQFSGSINIAEPDGNFAFQKTPRSLSIAGLAQKISIPSVGINIG